MPALQSQPEEMTLEEYESLPEDKRVEVFEGTSYDIADPSSVHQRLSMILSNKLFNYISKKGGSCEVFNAPFDVKLSEEPLTIVQPDVMVICDRDKIDDKRCNGAPDFIIEIVSLSNPMDDYVRKLYYYEKYGVREYWIVDPNRKVVIVNDFEAGKVGIQYTFDAIIKVNIYDDLLIDFSELTSDC